MSDTSSWNDHQQQMIIVFESELYKLGQSIIEANQENDIKLLRGMEDNMAKMLQMLRNNIRKLERGV